MLCLTETKKLFYSLTLFHSHLQTCIVNSLICWEQGCIGPFQWAGATVSFDVPGSAQIEQVWTIALFVEIQHDCENQGSLHWLHYTEWENCQGSHSGSNKEMKQDGVNLKDWRLLSYDSQATMTDIHSSVKKQIIDVNPLAVLGSVVLTLLQLALCWWCEDPDTDVVGNVECLVWPLFMFNQLTDCSGSVYEC